MLLLLSQVAADAFGHRLPADVTPLRMQLDGSLLGPGDVEVPWDEAEPDVAWGTADLFAEGGPLRPYFGFLVRNRTVRWFQSFAAGSDAPVFGELLGRGVRVTSLHVNSIPIAELVLRSVLERYQEAGRWRAGQAERRWDRHDFREVSGSSWLIVGLGHIGRAVAVRARAFDARVVGVRRSPAADDPVDLVVPPAELPAQLPAADVVVLAAPATPETDGLVDAAFLAAMKPGSLLVNVARGSLVDEAALLAALDRGVPEHAVLDVTVDEPPPPDHPFWDHPRVTLTPHNAGGGIGRYERAADVFLDNLQRYRCGEPLRDELAR